MAKRFFKKLFKKNKKVTKEEKKKEVKHPSTVRIKIEQGEYNPQKETHV